MTRAVADALLKADAQGVCDNVAALFLATQLTDGRLGAMTSLAYNIGVGEVGGAPDFADSSVRRRLIAGDVQGAADAFRMWRYAGGRELPGTGRSAMPSARSSSAKPKRKRARRFEAGPSNR